MYTVYSCLPAETRGQSLSMGSTRVSRVSGLDTQLQQCCEKKKTEEGDRSKQLGTLETCHIDSFDCFCWTEAGTPLVALQGVFSWPSDLAKAPNSIIPAPETPSLNAECLSSAKTGLIRHVWLRKSSYPQANNVLDVFTKCILAERVLWKPLYCLDGVQS